MIKIIRKMIKITMIMIKILIESDYNH